MRKSRQKKKQASGGDTVRVSVESKRMVVEMVTMHGGSIRQIIDAAIFNFRNMTVNQRVKALGELHRPNEGGQS